MLGKHEIPTHLEVEDKILFGLTVRQVLVLGFGLAIGYALWQHLGPSHTVTPGSHFLAHASLSSPVPAPLRILLAAIPFAGSAIIAFYRHGGRSAEDWMLAYARYLAAPKVSLWRTLPAALPGAPIHLKWSWHFSSLPCMHCRDTWRPESGLRSVRSGLPLSRRMHPKAIASVFGCYLHRQLSWRLKPSCRAEEGPAARPGGY